MNDTQWYRYEPAKSVARHVFSLWVGLLVLVFGGAFSIIRFVAIGLAWPIVALSFPILLFSAVPLIALAFITADISTNEDGLTLHVMDLYRHYIPWSALRHTTLWEVEPAQPLALLTLTKWEKVYALYVPGLKGHHVTGILFGLGRVPVIIITPDHAQSGQLIRRLKHLQHPMGRNKPRKLRR